MVGWKLTNLIQFSSSLGPETIPTLATKHLPLDTRGKLEALVIAWSLGRAIVWETGNGNHILAHLALGIGLVPVLNHINLDIERDTRLLGPWFFGTISGAPLLGLRLGG